jgi:hypothetical protein
MADEYWVAYCHVPGTQPASPLTPGAGAAHWYKKFGARTGPRESRAEGAKPQRAVTASPLHPAHCPLRFSMMMRGASAGVKTAPATVVFGTGTGTRADVDAAVREDDMRCKRRAFG